MDDPIHLSILTWRVHNHTEAHHWTLAIDLHPHQHPHLYLNDPTQDPNHTQEDPNHPFLFYHIFSTPTGYELTIEHGPRHSTSLLGPQMKSARKVALLPRAALEGLEGAIMAAVEQRGRRWVRVVLEWLREEGWVCGEVARGVRGCVERGRFEPGKGGGNNMVGF